MITDSATLTDFSELKKQIESNAPDVVKQAEQTALGLAATGSLEAAELLCQVYADGTTLIAPDRINEFKYARMAAELGSSTHRYWLAHLQRESGDVAGALENARMAHDMGDSFGTRLLVNMMLSGEGQPAKPLEALQLLSDDVAKSNYNPDSVVLLAEVYLDGKYFPPNPQKAYDTLHAAKTILGITLRVDSQLYARSLFLKGHALAAGANAADGETADVLFESAAQHGSEDARSLLQQKRHDAADAARERDWDTIAHFDAFGGRWMMFFRLGRLQSMQPNGAVRALHFVPRSGEPYKVVVPAKGKQTTGKQYLTVYIGPEGQTNGMPCLVIDPDGGKTFRSTADLRSAYPANASKFKGLLPFLLAGLTLVCFNAASLIAWLAGIASAIGAYQTWKAYRGGYKRAVADAARFATRYRSDFT